MQFKRSQKLLDTEFDEIFIHGLGVACNRAVNLALKLQAEYLETLAVDPKTSTVELTDELEPLTDEAVGGELKRSTSAIHIRVFKKAPLL